MRKDEALIPCIPPPLTAHALLRWLERAKGIPVSAIRRHMERRAGNALSDLNVLHSLHQNGEADIALASAEILTPKFIEAVRLVTALRGGCVRQGKIRFPVRNGVVVTALYAQYAPNNDRQINDRGNI